MSNILWVVIAHCPLRCYITQREVLNTQVLTLCTVLTKECYVRICFCKVCKPHTSNNVWQASYIRTCANNQPYLPSFSTLLICTCCDVTITIVTREYAHQIIGHLILAVYHNTRCLKYQYTLIECSPKYSNRTVEKITERGV